MKQPGFSRRVSEERVGGGWGGGGGGLGGGGGAKITVQKNLNLSGNIFIFREGRHYRKKRESVKVWGGPSTQKAGKNVEAYKRLRDMSNIERKPKRPTRILWEGKQGSGSKGGTIKAGWLFLLRKVYKKFHLELNHSY